MRVLKEDSVRYAIALCGINARLCHAKTKLNAGWDLKRKIRLSDYDHWLTFDLCIMILFETWNNNAHFLI